MENQELYRTKQNFPSMNLEEESNLYRTKQKTPTKEQYTALEGMFKHFRKTLFPHDKLPDCVLIFSREIRVARGYFYPNRWTNDKEIKHEICLNPVYLSRSAKDIASTLVHEMCHLWSEIDGSASRSGYHDKKWAFKMESVGLIPTDTGERGGKKVGQKVTHIIETGGVFEKAFSTLPEKYILLWKAVDKVEQPIGVKKPIEKGKSSLKGSKNKLKYSCPICQINVWGKPNLKIICDGCQTHFEIA